MPNFGNAGSLLLQGIESGVANYERGEERKIEQTRYNTEQDRYKTEHKDALARQKEMDDRWTQEQARLADHYKTVHDDNVAKLVQAADAVDKKEKTEVMVANLRLQGAGLTSLQRFDEFLAKSGLTPGTPEWESWHHAFPYMKDLGQTAPAASSQPPPAASSQRHMEDLGQTAPASSSQPPPPAASSQPSHILPVVLAGLQHDKAQIDAAKAKIRELTEQEKDRHALAGQHLALGVLTQQARSLQNKDLMNKLANAGLTREKLRAQIAEIKASTAYTDARKTTEEQLLPVRILAENALIEARQQAGKEIKPTTARALRNFKLEMQTKLAASHTRLTNLQENAQTAYNVSQWAGNYAKKNPNATIQDLDTEKGQLGTRSELHLYESLSHIGKGGKPMSAKDLSAAAFARCKIRQGEMVSEVATMNVLNENKAVADKMVADEGVLFRLHKSGAVDHKGTKGLKQDAARNVQRTKERQSVKVAPVTPPAAMKRPVDSGPGWTATLE